MNFERVVSSSRSKLDLEKNENEEMGQRQTTEVIGSDFRDSLLLLLLMQQLTIVWEIVLVPGCLLNKWKGTGGREIARFTDKYERVTPVFPSEVSSWITRDVVEWIF